MSIDGGVHTLGYKIWQEHPDWKVGVMICGNSGRPGGGVGTARGVAHDQVHAEHTTQEEDVVSAWLITQVPLVLESLYRVSVHSVS